MSSHSIARRLALMFALAAALVFAVTGMALYQVQRMEIRRHQVEEIRIRFEYIESLIARRIDRQAKWPALEEKIRDLTPGDGSVRYQIESSDPRFILGAPLADKVSESMEADGLQRIRTTSRSYLTLTKAIPANGERPEVRLTVGMDPCSFDTTRSIFAIALVLAFILGVAAVGALGWWIARRSLASVDHLSRSAQSLSAQNLAARLPTQHLPAELTGLVLSFNGALERVEQAYVQLSAFNADVAHELRTPLANLIGQTQVTLSRERSATELEETLQSNLEELERLRVIVNDMLFLAQADKGTAVANRVQTSLADEVSKSVEFLEMIIEDAGATVEIAGDAQAWIERSLFGRAITNLLYNALQHGAQGQPIQIAIEPKGEEIFVSVSNHGPHLEAAHLERLFDRFYRVDPARAHSNESHGLGLAIVNAIACMHGGSVFAASERGVTTIGFTIPTVQSAAPPFKPERTVEAGAALRYTKAAEKFS